MSLRRINADEFARRLKGVQDEQDKRYAFFLGAGCSISSGIPGAGGLVEKHWLPKLCGLRSPQCRDISAWAAEELPGYDAANPAGSYGDVMGQLFLQQEERQREIERLCDGRFPSFGYAALASLMALPGGRFNVALTTNFDDLIADALYLFTQARPLLIHHESLANYIRPTRTRPLVVKLHGDNRLSPQNTLEETGRIKEEIEKQVRTLLHDRGLIIMGYAGNDHGIAKMLEALPAEALPLGVYWVSGREPDCVLRKWLEARNAVWVESADFDEFMLLVRDALGLPHPDRKRFQEVFEKYTETYETLSQRIVAMPANAPEAPALKEAVRRTDESFPDWWAVELAASRLQDSDPAAADRIYQLGIAQFPTSASLIGNYAWFLENVRKHYDQAEVYYLRAVEIDPEHANNLGNCASFFHTVRKDYGQAEEFYRQVRKVGTEHVHHLGNYAALRLGLTCDRDSLSLLERAFENAGGAPSPLLLELWFYAFAHRPPLGGVGALRTVKQLLTNGIRSLGWDLSLNVERAQKDGHPHAEWLPNLAAVIVGEAPMETLDGWPEWAAAGPSPE